MAKVTFDGTNKLIIVDNGVTSLDAAIDLYSDWKEWMLTSDNSKYPLAFATIGGDDLGGGRYLGATYFLENGWKIRPYEGNHALSLVGNIYTRDGSSPFVSTLGNYNVLITSSVSNLIDTVETGVNSYSLDQIRDSVWSKSITAPSPGSILEYIVTKLLTFKKFFATKDV
jgi:hypothetical protein